MEPETKKGSDGSSGRKAATAGGSAKCVMKFLIPDVMAGPILGREGSKISAMRKEFSATIVLSEQGEVYPSTDCRVLTVQTSSEESLNEVTKHLIGIQKDLVNEDGAKRNAAALESLGHEGHLWMHTIVPRAAGGGVIGKKGTKAKELREKSGAKKVVIGEAIGPGPSADQKITVVGPVEALEYVLKEVNHQIQMLKEEAWFSSWVEATPTGSAEGWSGGAGGWGGGSGWSGGAGWSASHHDSPPQVWNGPPGWGSGSSGHVPEGLNTLIQVAMETPPFVMEDSRGFALTCTVPKRLQGGLIGRKGKNIQGVKERTGTDITIREIAEDPDNKTLNITGPLPNACAAYMLMMRSYLDAEAQAGGPDSR